MDKSHGYYYNPHLSDASIKDVCAVCLSVCLSLCLSADFLFVCLFACHTTSVVARRSHKQIKLTVIAQLRTRTGQLMVNVVMYLLCNASIYQVFHNITKLPVLQC